MSDHTQAQAKTYKKSLNLPRTPFPMRANLVQNEPASLNRWVKAGLYQALRRAEHPAGPYVFHDGPPYANGSIHLGHLLNKVLKDLVVRSHTMLGHDVPYIPGWDCHGLPIEHRVVQDLGQKAREMAPMQIRKRCRDYAAKYVKLQSRQFQRLLTLADYENPYLTMDPAYEAGVLEVFADLVQRGLVYRGLKPVHWSIDNRTALAEAELEYHEREDTSVYVRFDVAADSRDRLFDAFNVTDAELRAQTPSLVIWTTTPWTLPANLAVAVNPNHHYTLARVGERLLIVATELLETVKTKCGAERVESLGQTTGDQLAEKPGTRFINITYTHPFISDRNLRPVLSADYVTLDDGTGLVHIAPGHGTEDYQLGIQNDLPIYCPVQADGTFDATAPDWLQGLTVWDANDKVVEHLQSTGHLLHHEKFTHSYPHDWRGKTPVIFRATEQWFISVDAPVKDSVKFERGYSVRDRAIDEVLSRRINFIPQWGRNRLHGMLQTRPDWCISRQRAWGLPIPVFYNREAQPLLTPASVRAIAQAIGEHGSDYWFTAEPAELLAHYDPESDPHAPDWARSLEQASLSKGSDIFDVWFESGSSWHAVLRRRDMGFPADLYLEGSDQHRGWFQASLLPAVAATGQSPFKNLLTHGFMVDKHGRKMSKSLGNTLEVEDLLKNYGADVCRWWVASLNTETDIKVDEEFFKLAGEAYRKVRNTVRFLLSNLNDFDPAAHAHRFTDADAASLDAWVLSELNGLIEQVRDSYHQLNFRRAHDRLFHFCNETLSAVYLAAVKDRLYCDAADAPRRRRTQSALYRCADALIRLLAPILPHTADEAWAALHGNESDSVHLQRFPETRPAPCHAHWQQLMAMRDDWMRAIENARQQLEVDNPLDLGLRVSAGEQDRAVLQSFDAVDLTDLCMLSRFELTAAEGQTAVQAIDLRDQPRCERSWKRDGTVKQRSDGGMLSERDAAALGVA